MNNNSIIIKVPQVDGATRLLAIPRADYRHLRRDGAGIESVSVLGSADVSADGLIEYGRTGPHWSEVPAGVQRSLGAAALAQVTEDEWSL